MSQPTVKELLRLLAKLPPDDQVALRPMIDVLSVSQKVRARIVRRFRDALRGSTREGR